MSDDLASHFSRMDATDTDWRMTLSHLEIFFEQTMELYKKRQSLLDARLASLLGTDAPRLTSAERARARMARKMTSTAKKEPKTVVITHFFPPKRQRNS